MHGLSSVMYTTHPADSHDSNPLSLPQRRYRESTLGKALMSHHLEPALVRPSPLLCSAVSLQLPVVS